MQFHGLMNSFPKEIKVLILLFLIPLSLGFFGGISFVNNTTSMTPAGVESHYLGNENDEDAEIMQFKKSEREILTIVHGHLLSLSVIFFITGLLLACTSYPIKLKYFLMLEPFVSLLLTFGGIYFLWLGFTWVKYVIIVSGVVMTLSFALAVFLIGYELFKSKSSLNK